MTGINLKLINKNVFKRIQTIINDLQADIND